ncbi:MAG: deoxyribodipyrimidine photo-lyase, partial [Pseudomonadota bacterium]
CSMTGLHVTWFRQDLRVHDHAALRAACQSAAREGGQVLALFVWSNSANAEDQLQLSSDAFLLHALTDLRAALAQREAMLHLRQGNALEILSDLHTQHRIMSLHTHETGSPDPLAQQAEAWALRAGVQFSCHQQFQPESQPRGHESWQTVWERFMARPRHEAPDMIPSANVGIRTWPEAAPAPNETVSKSESGASSGGRKQAISELKRFLGTAVNTTPSTQSGQDAFAALRPHMELGTVSLREVWQAAVGAHQQALKAGLDIRAASIASFLHLLPTLSQASASSSTGQTRASRLSRPSRTSTPGQQLSLGLGETGQ